MWNIVSIYPDLTNPLLQALELHKTTLLSI